MKKLLRFSLMLCAGLMLLTFASCKKDPSVLKVYVRSASNQLLPGARVVIVGDIYSNPPTREYVDTIISNSTGYAMFNMDEYFGEKPEKGEVGYFDIIVKIDNKVATGRARVRANITNVETVKFDN